MNEVLLYKALTWAIPILFAITLHEAAHAYVAKFFGDNTAYSLGRMSLNPIRHIDPVGTVVLPVALLLVSSPFIFGYAKPVPVNSGKLRNPRSSMAFVALAGPLSNLLMVLMWQVAGIILQLAGIKTVFLLEMVKAGIIVNLVLFAFNLFPLPPLDGGRILTSILPTPVGRMFARIEPFGFFILIGLLYFGVLRYWMRPLMVFGQTAVHTVLMPLSFLWR